MRGAVFLTAAVTLIAAVQPGQATASAGHEAKRCGILAKGSADYPIKARKLTCRFARKWSRAYLNTRSAAPGFDCYRAGTNVTFYCANGAKAYWAERLTATTARHPGHGAVRVDVGAGARAGAFKPADIRVGTGDTVLWVWSGPDLDNTVTADPGQAEQFDSDPGGTPDRKLGDSFAHRFTSTGTYSYFCRRHPDQMKGTIRVVKLQGLGDMTRPRLTYRVRLTAYDDADNASRPAFARLRI